MKGSESESLSEVFGTDSVRDSTADLESRTNNQFSESQEYDDPIMSSASLEYGEDKGREVAQAVNQYVNQFDSLEDLRAELDDRDTTSGAAPLENIFQGDELNCSARTAAQVAYSHNNRSVDGKLNVQYDTLDVLGIEVPGKIPIDNHVCYEDSDDITPFDFGNQPNTEVFPEEAIVGVRAANLLTESDNPESRNDLSLAVRSMAEPGESNFVDGFMRAYKLDSAASAQMPETAQKAYEAVTSRFI